MNMLVPPPSAVAPGPTDAEIAAAVGRRAFEDGGFYAASGRVAQVVVSPDGSLLNAETLGTARRPYHQAITLVRGAQGGLSVRGICTCPVGHNCKHVAAALLAARRQHRLPPPAAFVAAPPPVPAPVPAALAPPATAAAAPLPHDIAAWLDGLRDAEFAESEDYPPDLRQRIFYVLRIEPDPRGIARLVIEPYTAGLRKDGSLGASVHRISFSSNWATAQKPRAMRPSDRAPLARLSQRRYGSASPEDDPPDTLHRVLATGRARFDAPQGPPIVEGPPRPARLVWQMRADGSQVPAIELDAGRFVALPEPWYLDPETGTAGPLAFDLPAGVVTRLLNAPPLPPLQAGRVRAELTRRLPGLAVPVPAPPPPIEHVSGPPRPVLTLFAGPPAAMPDRWGGSPGPAGRLALARLGFRYGDLLVPLRPPSAQPTLVAQAGRLMQVAREPATEQAMAQQLGLFGLARRGDLHPHHWGDPHADDFMPHGGDTGAWLQVMIHELPRLRAAGWEVVVDPDFPVRLVQPDGDIAADLSETSGIDWLELHLGVTIDGERVDLVPSLVQMLATIKGDLPAALAAAADDAAFTLPLPDGRLLSLPLGRIRPILLALAELFADGAIDPDETRIRFTRHNAAELAALEQAAPELVWQGGEALRILGRQLRQAGGAIPVASLPETFKGSLRPYQAEGVNWLQFLRDRGPGRRARRRHGPRQDRADPGASADRESRRPARPPGADRLPDQPGAELVRRSRAFRPRPARADPARPGTQAQLRRHLRPRPGDHHLPAAHPRQRRAGRPGVARAGAGRGAVDQEPARHHHPRRRRAESRPAPVPVRHADAEPSGRAVVAVRLPGTRLPRLVAPLPRPLPRAGGEARRRGSARAPRPPGAPVPAAPDQAGGRRRPAAQDGNRRAGGDGIRPAGAVRGDPPGDARAGARRHRRTRPVARGHHHPRCAAETAPGVLRSAAGEDERGEEGRLGQARPADGTAARPDRGRPAGAGVLAVHLDAGADHSEGWTRPTSRSRC